MIRHLAIAAVALAGVISMGGTAIEAQSDSDTLSGTTTLNTTTDAAPSVAAGITFTLLRDDIDATDELCEAASDAAIPTRTCSNLTQADYRIEIGGVPDGAIVVGTCNGIEQQLPPFDLVPFILGLTYDCTGTVSQPGVVLRRDPVARPELETFVTLTDPDGNEVAVDCELDERLEDGTVREWCTGLADGVYTAAPSEVPDGYRPALECAPLIDVAPTGTPLPDDRTTAPVSAERPLWECTRGEAVAPLGFSMEWTGDPEADTSWTDGLMANVVDADGVNVSASCAESSRTVDPVTVFFQCPGLANGVYDISLDGIPNEFTIGSRCSEVEVTDADIATCEVYVFDAAPDPGDGTGGDDGEAQEDGPDADTPAETNVPTTVLPATGTASSNVALAGLGVGALGIVLVLAVRRRRPQHHV